MSALFDYKTDVEQLSSVNGGISQAKNMKISTTTDKLKAQFYSGDSVFKFSIGPADAWLPSQSYIRYVVRVTQADGTTALVGNNFNFAFKGAAGLYNDAFASINGVQICKIQNNLLHTEALYERLNFNKTQKNELELSSVTAASRGTTSAILHAADGHEFLWRPSLPIFQSSTALGAGEYEIRLTHKSDSQACINGLFENQLAPGGADPIPADATLEIVEYNFCYKLVSGGKRVDTGSVIIDMDNIRVQTHDLSKGSTSTRFNVKPSTHALSVAFTDKRARGHRSISESRFICPANAYVANDLANYDNAAFLNRLEHNIKSLQIQFAGVSYPQNAHRLYPSGRGWKNMYYSMLLETGQYWDTSPNETYEEWLYNLGPHATFHVARDGQDKSSDVSVELDTEDIADPDVANMAILLADHYKSVARISYVNGAVTQVEVMES